MRTQRANAASALAFAVAATALASCADGPTSVAPDAEPRASFAISAAQRGELRAAIRFVANEEAKRAIARRALADDVAEAFDALAARIDADDRAGAERAIAVARRAVERYRGATANDDEDVVALEAMSLALQHAERLARMREAEVGKDAGTSIAAAGAAQGGSRDEP